VDPRACHFEENFTCLCLTSEGATYSPAKDKLAAKAACLLKVLKEFSLQPEGDLRERIAETLEQHEERGLARFLEGAVPVAKAILDMTRRDRQYAARVFKNTRANHSEIKAFFDCALKGLPFDLALRTTIRACPRCTMFFNLIMASVQAHVPAPARLCPEVPSACDHPSVMTAEGLIVLANWPPRPT